MTTIFSIVLTMGIVISVSLLAILTHHFIKTKRKEKLLDAFRKVASQLHFTVTKKEMMGSRIIAFDEDAGSLLYFARIKNKHEGYLIDFDDVRSVAVRREYGLPDFRYKYWSPMEPYIDKIMLMVEYKKKKGPVLLTFYERSVDALDELGARFASANRWQAEFAKRVTNATEVQKDLKIQRA